MRIILFCIIVLSLGCQPASAMSKKDVIIYFQGTQEPTAKDALWTSSDIFKVGVIDNGSSRDGYAQYVCSVLAESGLSRGTWVQIIDIVKLTRKNKWVKLGEAHCR